MDWTASTVYGVICGAIFIGAAAIPVRMAARVLYALLGVATVVWAVAVGAHPPGDVFFPPPLYAAPAVLLSTWVTYRFSLRQRADADRFQNQLAHLRPSPAVPHADGCIAVPPHDVPPGPDGRCPVCFPPDG